MPMPSEANISAIKVNDSDMLIQQRLQEEDEMDGLTDGGSQGEELDKVDEVEEDEAIILRSYKASNQRLAQMIDGLQDIMAIFEPGGNIRALRVDAAVYIGKMDHKLMRLRKKIVKMDKEHKTLESIVVNSDAKKKETAIITKIKSQES